MKRWEMKVQTEFEIVHKDGSKTKCLALEPKGRNNFDSINKVHEGIRPWVTSLGMHAPVIYHIPPEVFVSSSEDPNSIVYKWVEKHDGIGGIHHLALQVDDVYKVTEEWKADGVQFTTEQPLTCPEDGLTQIFSEPIPWLGHIVELITRAGHGFCAANVGDLMESTRHLSEQKVKIDHDAVEQLRSMESY